MLLNGDLNMAGVSRRLRAWIFGGRIRSQSVRIVQASLCLRFYRSAGWTRDGVRELLREYKRLARVIPRYYDRVRDQVSVNRWNLDDGLPHDECDYFAVYDHHEPFSAEALAEHEVVE